MNFIQDLWANRHVEGWWKEVWDIIREPHQICWKCWHYQSQHVKDENGMVLCWAEDANCECSYRR